MLSHWTRVSMGRGKKPVYLENPKYVQNQTFICGYEVDQAGTPKGSTLRLIQLGPGIKLTDMELDGRWKPNFIGNYDVTITLYEPKQ